MLRMAACCMSLRGGTELSFPASDVGDNLLGVDWDHTRGSHSSGGQRGRLHRLAADGVDADGSHDTVLAVSEFLVADVAEDVNGHACSYIAVFWKTFRSRRFAPALASQVGLATCALP